MISLLLFFATFAFTITMAIRTTIVYLFVLYQAYYFFNPPTKWWGELIPSLSYSFYIVLTLLLYTIFNWTKLSDNRITKAPQLMWTYVVVFLYAMASFYAVWPSEHKIALDAIATATVLITVIYKLCDTPQKLNLIIYGYIGAAGYLGYYITQVGRGPSGRFEGAGMVDSPDNNGVAAAIAPALIYCLYFFWTKAGVKNKLPFIVAGAFIANGLVLIGSRGAFLGVAAGTLIFLSSLFFSSTRLKYQKLKVIGLLLFGVVSIAAVTDDAFWQRIYTIKEEKTLTAEQQSGSTRFFFWVAAWDMAKDHPFGGGSSAFIIYSPMYIPENVDTGLKRTRAVHSTWMEALSEIGYLGLFALMTVVYTSMSSTQKAKKLQREKGNDADFYKVLAIQCSFITFIVAMTFLNRLRAELLYWCILYTACAYNIYFLKENKEQNGN